MYEDGINSFLLSWNEPDPFVQSTPGDPLVIGYKKPTYNLPSRTQDNGWIVQQINTILHVSCPHG